MKEESLPQNRFNTWFYTCRSCLLLLDLGRLIFCGFWACAKTEIYFLICFSVMTRARTDLSVRHSTPPHDSCSCDTNAAPPTASLSEICGWSGSPYGVTAVIGNGASPSEMSEQHLCHPYVNIVETIILCNL